MLRVAMVGTESLVFAGKSLSLMVGLMEEMGEQEAAFIWLEMRV